MATVTVRAKYEPAIRRGVDLTASAAQTVVASGGLYRRIPTGTLAEDVVLNLSPSGVADGQQLCIQREDTQPHLVTVRDQNTGAVLTVMAKMQKWNAVFEWDAGNPELEQPATWFLVMESQRS